MKYGQRARDTGRMGRDAGRPAQRPKEDVIRAFRPMNTTLVLRHVELWCTVNETQGTVMFCAPDGEDMSGEVLSMDALYNSACSHHGTFVSELASQLPPAEAAAMTASMKKAKDVLMARMEARARLLRDATRLARRDGLI